MKSLQRIYQYIIPHHRYLIGACLALIFTSSAVLGIGRGVSYLVDWGFGQQNPDLLNDALMLLLGVIILLAITTYARYYLITSLGEKVIADIRQDVFYKLLRLQPDYYEQTRTGDVLSRIMNDTTILQMVVGSSLSVVLRNGLLLIGGMVLLVMTSPKLTLYVLLIVPTIIIPIIYFGKKVRGLSRHTQQKIASMNSYLEESIAGMTTIQANIREPMEQRLFQNYNQDTLSAAYAKIRMRAALTALVILIVFGAIGFVLWSGGHDVILGVMSPGELTSFIFYAVVVAAATGAISEILGDLQKAVGATERLFEILEEPTSLRITEPLIAASSLNDTNIAIHINRFCYPTRPDHAVLKDIAITIESGQTVALVGPSGGGKTTIFNLLLRFYDQYDGSITIDGTDITQIALPELRNLYGLVPQNPMIFSSTIRENIAYANPNASDEAILQAAKSAMAKEFIDQMPHGLDSYVGEKGIQLSGGQKQRIAIARAILKDPQILLLDEATSALDAANEQLVQQALTNLMQNRTTIVIAHRLSTIQKADRIVVIDQGSIQASGTHQDLMQEEQGLYAHLAALQLLDKQ